MTVDLDAREVRAILLDIEGTTTPIAFVTKVLFPFARAHVRAWLDANRGSSDLAEIGRALSGEHAADVARGEHPPSWPAESRATVAANDDGLVAYVDWLMDRDRKSPGLKRLQGLIWERGYQAGTLRGEVFPDVPAAIRRWRAAGVDVAIYSSGSALAQRRLFESTEHGDLTPLLSGFFDTAVGAKGDADSYRQIAVALGQAPSALLFLSDVVAELDAASAAGVQAVLSIRPGNPAQPRADAFPAIRSFDEVVTAPRPHNRRGVS